MAHGAIEHGGGTRGKLGLTLIETVIVIALIGVLVSLLLPTLVGVRDVARDAVGFADLRTHAKTLHTYSMDFDGLCIAPNDPDADWTVVERPDGRRVPRRFFQLNNSWHWTLLGSYYDGLSDAFVDPDPRKAGGPMFSDYLYSVCLTTDPKFWNRRTRTGPEQWGAARVSDIQYPSKKGVFMRKDSYYIWDADPDAPRPPWGGATHTPDISFADGSAKSVPYSETGQAYWFGEGDWPGSWADIGSLVLHTIDGARGRDVD